MFGLSGLHLLTLHGAVTSAALLTYVGTSRVLAQQRSPTAAIAWVLFILLVPYLALPSFLVFGTRKRKRDAPARRPSPPLASQAGRHGPWATATLLAVGQPAPAACEQLQVHRDGDDAFAALVGVVRGAGSSIDLCTFILAQDEVGRSVIRELTQQALRGVRVRVMVDGVGTAMAGHADFGPLVAAGGSVLRWGGPVSHLFRSDPNLRNHRKLLIADAGTPAARLWCGGRNLADEYFGLGTEAVHWRDLSFHVRGPIVQQASDLFERDWAFASDTRAVALAPGPGPSPAASTGGAQLVASGPDQADDTLLALLLTAAYRAQARILVATPYFVPDPSLLMALCLAARRGVQVELLVPGRSNHRLSDLARHRALRALAAAGARVRLTPVMLHAKLVVVDDVLALAGSANLDMRSLFLNYELMLAFHERGDVEQFVGWFAAERTRSTPHQPSPPGFVRDIAEGLLLWLAFQM